MQHKSWDAKIDIWSTACVFFEMVTSVYLFDGDSESDMILSMVECLGVPPREFLQECRGKHLYFNRDNKLRSRADLHPLPLDRLLVEEFNYSDSDAFAICRFLKPMLHFSPNVRASADELLKLYP